MRPLGQIRQIGPIRRIRRIAAALGAALLALAGCERGEKLPVVTTKSGAEMVLIPGGWFEMGSAGGRAEEAPVHKVWVDSFLMDRYEVTQEQYDKVIVGNPAHFRGAKRPVEQIAWDKAVAYCNARSRAEGLTPCYDVESVECNFAANGYRLPTEAEWEYACRAGSTTEYSFGSAGASPSRASGAAGLKDSAWFAENSGKETHPVGLKKPNRWGLYDLYGNVAEWCNDRYGASFYKTSPDRNPRGPARGPNRVLRGGAWDSAPEACRSAARVAERPGLQDACFARNAIGFRCVRNASRTDATDEKRSK